MAYVTLFFSYLSIHDVDSDLSLLLIHRMVYLLTALHSRSVSASEGDSALLTILMSRTMCIITGRLDKVGHLDPLQFWQLYGLLDNSIKYAIMRI
jgi:hypothetical protein